MPVLLPLMLFVALGLTFATSSHAQAPTSASARELEWYTAEVPVHSQESRERDAALGRALAQVLVRVTGRATAPTEPVVQRALRVAETMVTATEFRDVEEMAGGVPVRRQVLVASFDPELIDALVMAAGLPLWTGERPRPMLWLVIDDGGAAGSRLVSAQQLAVVKPLAQRGLERGLRFLLPSGAPVEQAAVDSIEALDAASIGILTRRYGARVQLLGTISRAAGNGWQVEWLLADGAIELKRWRHVDLSPQRVIASGADNAADLLAGRQSTVVAAGNPEVIEAEILGLSGKDQWLRLAAHLHALPVLRGYQVLEAHPDRLRLRLDLAVDRLRFEAMLSGGGVLAVEAVDPASRMARYRVLQ